MSKLMSKGTGNFEHNLVKIQAALDKLIERANEDGIITDEEQSILKKAEEGLNEYKAFVDTALEDGIIDQYEKNTLVDLEEKLISGTYFAAMEDEKLDADELLLLRTLIQTLDPKASISWLDEDHM